MAKRKRTWITSKPQLQPVIEEEEEDGKTDVSSRSCAYHSNITNVSSVVNGHSGASQSHTQMSMNITAAEKTKIRTKYIQTCIVKTMPDASVTSRHERVLQKLNDVFYKEKGSLKLSTQHQKEFSLILLRISIIPFKSEKCPKVERIIALITKIIQTFGTEEDREAASFPFNTPPLYYEVLKCLSKDYVHFEDRHAIRYRVVELIDNILTVHNEHHVLSNGVLRKTIRDLLVSRIRDKYPGVRGKAAFALRFFLDDVEIRKGVKYYAMYDPHVDVRKNCLLSMKTSGQVSSDFFYTKAFDRSAKVAIEAFKVISERPMTLKPEKMQKLLHWGLRHSCDEIRRFVSDVLICAWLKESNGILNFLLKLDLSFKPKTAACILDGIIRENTEEAFEEIDKAFLNDKKLVPVESISLEKMIFWLYLCSKFKDKNYCLEKLIPSASDVISYLQAIVDKIHDENEQAELEDREEDVTYVLCLSHAIRILGLCKIEESTRRDLEHLMIQIMIDPILDEAPLLVVAVDTLHQIVDLDKFQYIIAEVVQKIFDPTQPDATSTSRRRNNTASASLRSNKDLVDSPDVSFTTNEECPNFHPVNASTPMVTQSRLPKRLTELTEEGRCRNKEQLADFGLQRNKLICKRDMCKDRNNFLEAMAIQKEIEKLETKEDGLRSLLGLNDAGQTISRENESLLANKTAQDLLREFDSRLVRETSPIQEPVGVIASQPMSSHNPTITDSCLVRGIVISTRFLVWFNKIIPNIRQFIDNEISRPLLSEDSRVRIHTLQLLCVFALLDKREARKVMTAQLRALTMDTIEVQAAAFKNVVDLLLKYKYEDFKFTEGDDTWPDLPNCLNNANAANNELENFLISTLDSFATNEEDKSIKNLEGKVQGQLKLLLRGAVTVNSESLIAKLLCMWVDPVNAGTDICSDIAYWLPRYANLSVINAKRVAKGLLISLEKVLDYEDEEESGVNVDNAFKLFELVLASISSECLRQCPDGNTIHASLAFQILDLILGNITWKHNNFLGRIINRLEITEYNHALKITKVIGKILATSMALNKTSAISRTKSSLIRLQTKLSKCFENLPELAELNESEIEDECSTPSAEPVQIFSDSSVSDIFDHSELEATTGKGSSGSSSSSSSKAGTAGSLPQPVTPVKRKQQLSRNDVIEKKCNTRRPLPNGVDEELIVPVKRRRLDKEVALHSLTINKKKSLLDMPRRTTRSMSEPKE